MVYKSSVQERSEELRNTTEEPGISTGIKGLDVAINGLQPATMLTVAAYSGTGKTSWCTDVLLATAKEVPSVMFTLEMSDTQIYERMLYNVAELNYFACHSGHIDDNDRAKLDEADAYIHSLNTIYLDNTSRVIYPQWALDREDKEDSIELAMKYYYEQGCRELLNYGPDVVVCKKGREGSSVFSQEEAFAVPVEVVEVVDNTGAGDVYNAGFLAGMILGKSLRDCALFATRVAAKSLSGFGRDCYPTEEDLTGFFNATEG